MDCAHLVTGEDSRSKLHHPTTLQASDGRRRGKCINTINTHYPGPVLLYIRRIAPSRSTIMRTSSILFNRVTLASALQVASASSVGAPIVHDATAPYSLPFEVASKPVGSASFVVTKPRPFDSAHLLPRQAALTRPETNKKLNALAAVNKKIAAEWGETMDPSEKARLQKEFQANETQALTIATNAYQAQLRYVNEQVGQLSFGGRAALVASLDPELVYTWPKKGLGKAPSEQELSGNGIILL
jgi:hypothetical protein